MKLRGFQFLLLLSKCILLHGCLFSSGWKQRTHERMEIQCTKGVRGGGGYAGFMSFRLSSCIMYSLTAPSSRTKRSVQSAGPNIQIVVIADLGLQQVMRDDNFLNAVVDISFDSNRIVATVESYNKGLTEEGNSRKKRSTQFDCKEYQCFEIELPVETYTDPDSPSNVVYNGTISFDPDQRSSRVRLSRSPMKQQSRKNQYKPPRTKKPASTARTTTKTVLTTTIKTTVRPSSTKPAVSTTKATPSTTTTVTTTSTTPPTTTTSTTPPTTTTSTTPPTTTTSTTPPTTTTSTTPPTTTTATTPPPKAPAVTYPSSNATDVGKKDNATVLKHDFQSERVNLTRGNTTKEITKLDVLNETNYQSSKSNLFSSNGRQSTGGKPVIFGGSPYTTNKNHDKGKTTDDHPKQNKTSNSWFSVSNPWTWITGIAGIPITAAPVALVFWKCPWIFTEAYRCVNPLRGRATSTSMRG